MPPAATVTAVQLAACVTLTTMTTAKRRDTMSNLPMCCSECTTVKSALIRLLTLLANADDPINEHAGHLLAQFEDELYGSQK